MSSGMIRRRRRERNAIIPRSRVYRDRSNPLETMTDSELFERYRFRRPTIEFITNGISHLLTSSTRRNEPFLPIVQILLFLRFVATGAHLAHVGDHLGVSESATGRACRKVWSQCRAIWRIFYHVIRFPDGERAQEVQEGFRRIAGTFSYSISMSSTIFAMFLLCRLFSAHDFDNYRFRLCPLDGLTNSDEKRQDA